MSISDDCRCDEYTGLCPSCYRRAHRQQNDGRDDEEYARDSSIGRATDNKAFFETCPSGPKGNVIALWVGGSSPSPVPTRV